MFLEEPANPATGSETTTEEDMFGKPVVLGKGMHITTFDSSDSNSATTISNGDVDRIFYDRTSVSIIINFNFLNI
jgi:hypothetical protein